MVEKTTHAALLRLATDQRRAIGRRLHNDIAQSLTLAILALKRARADDGPAPAHTQAALAALDDTLVALRTLTVELHPSLLDQVGLQAALRLYAESVLDRLVSVDAADGIDALDEHACRAAYWLGQYVLDAAPDAEVVNLDMVDGRLRLTARPAPDAVDPAMADTLHAFGCTVDSQAGSLCVQAP